jgi:hypothetical protein
MHGWQSAYGFEDRILTIPCSLFGMLAVMFGCRHPAWPVARGEKHWQLWAVRPAGQQRLNGALGRGATSAHFRRPKRSRGLRRGRTMR